MESALIGPAFLSASDKSASDQLQTSYRQATEFWAKIRRTYGYCPKLVQSWYKEDQNRSGSQPMQALRRTPGLRSLASAIMRAGMTTGDTRLLYFRHRRIQRSRAR